MDAILKYTAAEINEMLAKLKAGGAATPSGDPQHYAYEAVGASWNGTGASISKSTPWGQVDHLPGCWYLNGVGDLTSADMRKILALGYFNQQECAPLSYGSATGTEAYRGASVRVNLGRTGMWNASIGNAYLAYYNVNIEVINLGLQANLLEGTLGVSMQGNSAFTSCAKLRAICGANLELTAANNDTFKGCSALEYVRIKGLKQNLVLSASPLRVECATYLLQNASTSATFSVTFRADRQAIYEANADFVAAKNARTNITILYQ